MIKEGGGKDRRYAVKDVTKRILRGGNQTDQARSKRPSIQEVRCKLGSDSSNSTVPKSRLTMMKTVANSPPPSPPKKGWHKQRSEATLIKPSESKSFTEIFREFHNIKPEDAGVDVKFMRLTRTGSVHVELGWNTGRMNIFGDMI